MKILFVSIASPPKTAPESLQVGRVISEMVKQGHSLTLITEKLNYQSWSTKKNSTFDLFKKVKVLKVRSGFSFLNRLLLKVKIAHLFSHELKYLFPRNAGLIAKSIGEEFDFIYSRSLPVTSAKAALKIKKDNKSIPWVLHLSDPWSFNPYNKKSSKLIRIERKCFENADVITFTNLEVLKKYKELYPLYSNKFYEFPNVVEPSHRESVYFKDKDSLTIAYVGNLYGNRHPDLFLKSLSSFIDALSAEQKKSVKCLFVGNFDGRSLEAIRLFKHKSNLTLMEQVSHNEAKVVMKSADALLTIDGDFRPQKHPYFFPSKLLDYMMIGRPIICLTDVGSPSYNFINNIYGRAFNFDQETQLKEYLEELYEAKSINLSEVNKNYLVKGNVDRLINRIKNKVG